MLHPKYRLEEKILLAIDGRLANVFFTVVLPLTKLLLLLKYYLIILQPAARERGTAHLYDITIRLRQVSP